MNLTEGAVTVVGVIVGYWCVSKLFFPASPVQPEAKISGAPATPAARGWPEILGVAGEATVDQIREAYKQLVSKYHPDKVDNLGQELKDLAQRKTQEITAAYREAMLSRGAEP